MMLGSKSKRKFNAFVAGIKCGEDVPALLGFHDDDFDEIPFTAILDNPGDIASGVIRMRKLSGISAFDMFDSVTVKDYDSGDIKYMFSTITSESHKIGDLADVLFHELGPGLYDSTRHSSFHDDDKLRALARGQYLNSQDELVHLWIHGQWVILLQYRIEPLCEFSLFVTRKKPQEIDRSIRRNGTILDILSLDIREVLQLREDSRLIDAREHDVRFVDYRYNNIGKVLGVFTGLTIRLFQKNKEFREDVHTNVTFTARAGVSTRSKIEVMDKLVRIYGPDDLGLKDIALHEVDLLEAGDYWTGRTWNFNEAHGLWNIENDHERFAYSVALGYDSLDAGFNLSIIGYNNLIALFSIR
jgi:hypothetical protein